MQLTATPPTVRPGDTVVITGTGYPPNCDLEVFVDGNSIGTVTTDGDGTFTIDWVVPSDHTAGTVVISTDVSNIEVMTNVEVVTATTPTTPAPTTPGAVTPTGTGGQGTGILPQTGSQVLPFVGVGVLLLVLGSMMVLANRKRGTVH